MQEIDSNIILDIQNLSCGYGDIPVVQDFNLQVLRGESIAIIGPNGCGKSTLLKAIYQLCLINSGSIYFNGILLNKKTPEDVKKMGIAYFMQKNAIFSKLNVKENLILTMNDLSAKNNKIEEAINFFPDIKNWLNKTAGLLSGGQRQQLSMAMLLIQNADLWLLDEPTAGLDENNSLYFLTLIQNHLGKTKENNKTLIFVEHNKIIINQLASRIINLNN